jgi:hypothetical protein
MTKYDIKVQLLISKDYLEYDALNWTFSVG